MMAHHTPSSKKSGPQDMGETAESGELAVCVYALFTLDSQSDLDIFFSPSLATHAALLNLWRHTLSDTKRARTHGFRTPQVDVRVTSAVGGDEVDRTVLGEGGDAG